MSILVSNAEIITAERRWHGDIRCREGRIVELGKGLDPGAGEEQLDAGDLLVFPGGVDPHVHMQLAVAGTVSADDFESGTAAALAGGTTTVIDFVHPERCEDFLEALRARRDEAQKAVVDYGLHMAVTWWGEQTAKWMERCVREEGIPSFKIYMAYLETVGLGDGEIIQVLETSGRLGAVALVHAEHGPIIEHLREEVFAAGQTGPAAHPRTRPPDAEGEANGRVALMARHTGAQIYIVHVTCRQALQAIAEARRHDQRLWAETCPQYLLLDESVYDLPDFESAAYVIAPPIRAKEHQEALWQALADGTLQAVGTDHCPFNLAGQKELGRDDFRLIPGGAAGVEHRLALLYTHGVTQGRFDLHRFVDLISTGPARIFGLYPRKGTIELGADADLVLWDPAATSTISAATHHHRCDRSIFEGFQTIGTPVTVIANGEIRYHDGALRAEIGAGRFLSRAAN